MIPDLRERLARRSADHNIGPFACLYDATLDPSIANVADNGFSGRKVQSECSHCIGVAIRAGENVEARL